MSLDLEVRQLAERTVVTIGTGERRDLAPGLEERQNTHIPGGKGWKRAGPAHIPGGSGW